MSKILLNGCSISNTCGWNDPAGKVWWHPLSTTYGGKHNITNLSVNGNTNHDILSNTMSETLVRSYDLVLVQWTSLLRQNFYSAKSIDSDISRVHVGLMPKRPLRLSRLHFKNSVHKKSLEHWQEHFVNLQKFYDFNLTYFISLTEYLKGRKIPFVFLNCTNQIHWADLLIENFDDTSEDYRHQVFLCPHSDYDKAKSLHAELYAKTKYLVEISHSHWVSFGRPLRSLEVDTADDNMHPGLETGKLILQATYDISQGLGYDL